MRIINKKRTNFEENCLFQENFEENCTDITNLQLNIASTTSLYNLIYSLFH